MTRNLGFIGVGHFAGYLIEGFSKACPYMKVTLSPRGKEQAEKLSQQYGHIIAENNQAVVDASDTIILSVRPNIVEQVLSELKFREDQTIISVAAGIHHEKLLSMHLKAKVVCALPLSSAAINQSPTLVFPENVVAEDLLGNLGPVMVMDSQEQMTSASTYSAFYGWSFRFIKEMASWGAENGLSSEMSRELLQHILAGSAGMAAKEKNVPIDDIVKSLATPGGITELGLNVIDGEDGFKSWHHAMDAVYKRLSNKK